MTGRRRILVATTNQHKLQEFREILAGEPFELVGPDDLGIGVSLEETGTTFEQNAVLKALAYAEAARLPALADDSGLEIDALGGEPGVYSARWAGDGVSYPERFRILFERLRDMPDERRGARYRAAIAFAEPPPYGLWDVVSGTLEGRIAQVAMGTGGFGYDPIFVVPSDGRSVGQMTAAEKHRISHRGRAGVVAAASLRRWLAERGAGQG